MNYCRHKKRSFQQCFIFKQFAIGLFFALPVLTLAGTGYLDSTFGDGGIVITPIVDSPTLFERSHSMLVQPDGKIVVCGIVMYDDGETGYPVSTFLARYDPNGRLDPLFGTGGKVVFGGTAHVGFNMALQSDGKIVTVGHSFPGNLSYAVYRFNRDGTPDISFGVGGAVFPRVVGGGQDVAVQPDGKIIIVGNGNAFTDNDNDFAVVRLHGNGSLDNSFGTGGIVITEIRTGRVSDEPSSVVLQPDGKIIVLGRSSNFVEAGLLALVRYNPNGSLDADFGEGGKVTQAAALSPFSQVGLQPDGKIVVAGTSKIFRYNPNGSLDMSFAAKGVLSLSPGFGATSVALQPDGKIVSFGSQTIGELSEFAVMRFSPNGAPDAGFGANGKINTPIGKDSSYAIDGAIQPDGKILEFGLNQGPDGTHLALVRYLSLSVSGVSAASFRGPELAADSIVAAFGSELATETMAASSTPLPTSLAGTTVKVRDITGIERDAPLFFVSPMQVTYLMPPGTAVGTASVTVTSGDGKVSIGVSQIATVAPGLFTATASGQGLAAAVVFRVREDGSQSYEPVGRPIDLGPPSDRVYLVLFGTGIRHRSSLASVIATIGGTYAEVSFAGASGDFTGLDQINVLLPRSLAGRGQVEILLTVETQIANAVRIIVK